MSLPQNNHIGDQVTQEKENINSLVTYWMWRTLEEDLKEDTDI